MHLALSRQTVLNSFFLLVNADFITPVYDEVGCFDLGSSCLSRGLHDSQSLSSQTIKLECICVRIRLTNHFIVQKQRICCLNVWYDERKYKPSIRLLAEIYNSH